MIEPPTNGVELEHASHTEQQSVRRRDERIRLQIPALVHSHGRFQTVVIDDFSSGGMRLQRCFGLGGRDEITVELLSGDRLPARVAWSVGNRVGVSFLQTLSPEHPAMVALQQIAQRTPNVSNSTQR